MGKHRYGLVFDAGSSGTRVYIYRWLTPSAARLDDDGAHLHSLPQIKTKKSWIKKVHPGVSTFGPDPSRIGPDHLAELIDFAATVVPEKDIPDTPIFLLATAGMRLLPPAQRTAVLGEICGYFQQHTKFLLPDCGLHVQVIPGETEGLYGWIAANYLLGGFDAPDKHDHGKGHHTYGFLDMGGASAQIAFAPNATEAERHAEDLQLLRLRRVDGEEAEYRVFVTTWLGFGANEARRRYVQRLVEMYPSGTAEVPDPCLPKGIRVTMAGEEIPTTSAAASRRKDVVVAGEKREPYLLGTGQFAECLKATYPLLEKEKECKDPPCLLNGVHTPSIDFDVNHFVGVSEFWHTTHGVFASDAKGSEEAAYDFATYQKQVTDFCSREWSALDKDVTAGKWGKKIDAKTVEETCFKASWLINVLHEGISVPRVGLETNATLEHAGNKTVAIIDGAKKKGFLDPFQAVDKIDGKEVSWTLGKIVMYAASEIPPAEGALAVGFGSNVNGHRLPSDFQYAGGSPILPSASDSENNKSDFHHDDDHDDDDDHNGSGHDDDDDWHTFSLKGHYSQRVPGIVIFLLILLLAVYLLCGRDRRITLYNKCLTMLGRRPTAGAIRLKRSKSGASSSPTGLGKILGLRGNGSGSPRYERVLEDGNAGSGSAYMHPDDFELASVASSLDDLDRGALGSAGSSTSSIAGPGHLHHTAAGLVDLAAAGGAGTTAAGAFPRSGRTSGIATPAIRGTSPDYFGAGSGARTSPKGLGGSSLAAGGVGSLGLGSSLMAEGRDGGAAAIVGRRSRRGSLSRSGKGSLDS